MGAVLFGEPAELVRAVLFGEPAELVSGSCTVWRTG
jgi:hypothetical protein